MKRSILVFLIISVSAIVFQYCVEPFSPERLEFENALVVEGFISDELKKHEIVLSRTYPIDTSQFIAESGANVWIEDGNGNEFNFNEEKPGHYYPGNAFQGEIGMTYKLHITTSDDSQFESEEVTLKDTPPIDSVYARFIDSSSGEVVSGVTKNGLQIYVDTHDPDGKLKYYRWEWVDTYEIRVPFPSANVYDRSTKTVSPRDEQVGTCWSSDSSSNILIKTTANLSSNRVSQFPIHFVNEETQQLRIRYSILVKQYALSAEGYFFWENLRKINETQGGLADIQPGVLEGNIRSVENNDQTVLGYFDAAKVSKERIFINPNDFRDDGLVTPPYFYRCEIMTIGSDQDFYDFMAQNGNSYEYLYYNMDPMNGGHVIAYYLCADCTRFSNNNRPDFWED